MLAVARDECWKLRAYFCTQATTRPSVVFLVFFPSPPFPPLPLKLWSAIRSIPDPGRSSAGLERLQRIGREGSEAPRPEHFHPRRLLTRLRQRGRSDGWYW